MIETAISNILSGGTKQPPKKDNSTESGKTDFQDLLAAAKDKVPDDKPEANKPEQSEAETNKPETDKPQANNPEANKPNTDEKMPDEAAQMLLLFGMPQILQPQDTSTTDALAANTEPQEPALVIEAANKLETENAAQQAEQSDAGKQQTAEQKTSEQHTFITPDKPKDETVKVTSDAAKMPEKMSENMAEKTPENKAEKMPENMAEKMPENMAVNTKQETQQELRTIDETTGSKKETAPSEAIASAALVQKDQGVQQPRTNEVLPHVHINESQPQQMTKDISDVIAKGIQNGRQEFEIQLEPLHLGKLAIKVTYEAGKAAVSILCSSTKTLEAMAQNAKEIGAILDYRLGTDTQIIVEHPETDYLNQQNQQKEQEQGGQKEQEQSQKEQTVYDKDGVNRADFLQQLRLGLA